jgi:hypothetical protein
MYYLLFGYALYVLIALLVIMIKSGRRDFLQTVLIFLLGYFVIAFITPFLMIIAPVYFSLNDTYKTKVFTIHKLTTKNRTTLEQLGFIKGNFISTENLDYKGFRNKELDIRVQYNGRVSVKYLYRLSREQKYMINIIRNLPKEEKND